jgi:uncharacterized protein (DUF952 family)
MSYPTLLEAETRYDPAASGEGNRFPHVFGPIKTLDALEVRQV